MTDENRAVVMSPLADFLGALLTEGRAVLRRPPAAVEPSDPAAAAVLRRAYATHRLQVAGPPLDFDLPLALSAAALVQWSCWLLVSRAETDAEMAQTLALPGPPRTPAQHLSADLLLRLLPAVHRRARALNPSDRLPALLADVLRRWPLSGVLADVAEEPLTPPDFDGHAGLRLLYAERLARCEKPAWVPRGPAAEPVALVWAELGRDASALLAAAAPNGEDTANV
jgi:hypothetical protein